MEGAKILEAQHRGTRRRSGIGTCAQFGMEREKSVSAPALTVPGLPAWDAPGSGETYNRHNREVVERRAEVGGGHSSDDGRDNITRPERRTSSQVCGHATAKATSAEEPRRSLGPAANTLAAWNVAGRLPGGEPCKGEPYARFGKGAAGDGACSTHGDGLSPRWETPGHGGRAYRSNSHRACPLLHHVVTTSLYTLIHASVTRGEAAIEEMGVLARLPRGDRARPPRDVLEAQTRQARDLRSSSLT